MFRFVSNLANPGWLERFGFEYRPQDRFDGNYWYKENVPFGKTGIYTLIIQTYNGNYTIEGNHCPVLIYVHQLQNLYFALTGKELEFKP